MKIVINFRWPVKQINDTAVEFDVEQLRGAAPIITEEWADRQKLSASEYQAAEIAAIKAVAVIS